jgi:hypothetical protein
VIASGVTVMADRNPISVTSLTVSATAVLQQVLMSIEDRSPS